jgi:Flp pilus assembly secretin CpaC
MLPVMMASVAGAAEDAVITVVVGESATHPLKAPANRINVGSRGIVSLYMPEPESLSIKGSASGFTYLTIQYPDGTIEQLAVRVLAAPLEVVARLTNELTRNLASVPGVKVKQSEDKIRLTGTTDSKGMAYVEQLTGMFEGIVVNEVRVSKRQRRGRRKSTSDKLAEYLVDEKDLKITQVEGKTFLRGVVDQKNQAYYEQIVSMFEKDVVDLVEFRSEYDSVQVDVQVVEVQREKSKDLGIEWFSGGPWQISGDASAGSDDGLVGMVTLETVTLKLIALSKEGKARFLATPKLVVQSGKEASLLVGGELPIAQSTGLAASVEWKKFGTQLDIAPTILDEDTIFIDLTAIVSDFDFSQTVQGYPTLRSREASTKLKVEDGHTFAIAGIFTNIETQNVNKVPLLGSIPVLGYLFKRKTDRSNLNETIVFFTPRILREAVLTPSGVPSSLTPTPELEKQLERLGQAE